VLGVALATIQQELGLSQTAAHWVVNAYLLAMTCLVALGGKLCDRISRRATASTGVGLFATASLIAGLAGDGGWVIGARAIQGTGAALMFPAAWAMVTRAFAAEERGHAFGIMVTISAVFMALGPFAGGLLVDHASWRWIFWINLPFCAAIIAMVLLAGPESADADDAATGTAAEPAAIGPLDLRGLFALLAGLTALVTALMEGPNWGWGSIWTLGLLALGLALMALFVTIERSRTLPLIDLDLLKIPTFTGGNLVFVAFQFNKITVFVFCALFLQDVMEFPAMTSGLIVLAGTVPTFFTSFLGGKAADRWGSRPPLLLALAINTAALVCVALAMALENTTGVALALVFWGIALPVIAVPARRALMGAVPADQQGQASGVNLTTQMFGGTLAMAICGSLLAVTGSYAVVFATNAAVGALALAAAWLLVDRQKPGGNPP
jgi:MFS family permease